MNLTDLLAAFASAFDQRNRLISLDIGQDRQWDGRLLPQSIDGQEAVSDGYRYTVDCLSPDTSLALRNLLGLSARLAIRNQDGNQVVRGGVISQAQVIGSDGGFTRYRLVVEPPFALLRYRSTSRVFQDLSVPDIVKQVVAEHQAHNPVFARLQTLTFQLSGLHAPRSYTLQYRESDYDFLRRLMHEEGLAWRFEHIDDGDQSLQSQLTVFDDPYSLPQSSQQRVRFHRSDATEAEDGLTDWQTQRRLGSNQVSLASYDYKTVQTGQGMESSTRALSDSERAAQSTLEDYQPQVHYYASDADGLTRYAQQRQQAHDLAAQGFEGSGTVRGLQAGHWFRLDNHPAHDSQPADQREFVVTQQSFHARNNLPEGLARQRTGTDDDVPYRTTFQAQPRGVPLSPAYAGTAHAKPTARGAQTATVVGPAGEEVHTDAQGRIKVQFHWARSQEHPDAGAAFDERSSCWVRVAMPSAGAGWGHQFIPRVGQEVLVTFLENDIDRPLVTGVLYNGSHATPTFSDSGTLPGNKTLSGIKSKEHQGSGHNELVFDDTPNQVRSRLASTHGATQLNQGFLTHPRKSGKAEPRGEGFELRTDQHGAVRAAHGLLLTTEAQQNAAGKQLARSHAQARLDAALALSQSLGEVAAAQLADTIETGPQQINPDNSPGSKTDQGHQQQLSEALKAWEAGTNTGANAQGAGQQPILVMSAPAGIASVSEQSQTLAAGTNLDLVAQRDANHTAGRRWLANVGHHISLFVAGVKDAISLKLIASRGNVQVQAQSGEMELTSAQSLQITSTKGKVTLHADKEILLASGGGYIRLVGGNIEVHCPGSVSIKGANHALTGPASMNVASPELPTFAPGKVSQQLQLIDPLTGEAQTVKVQQFTDGTLVSKAKSDAGGRSGRVISDTHHDNVSLVGPKGEWDVGYDSAHAPFPDYDHVYEEPESGK